MTYQSRGSKQSRGYAKSFRRFIRSTSDAILGKFTVSQTTSVRSFHPYLATTHRPSISSPPMRFPNRMKFSFLSVCYISYPYHLYACVSLGRKYEWNDATRVVYDTYSKTNVTLKSEKTNNFISGLKLLLNDTKVYNNLRLLSINM